MCRSPRSSAPQRYTTRSSSDIFYSDEPGRLSSRQPRRAWQVMLGRSQGLYRLDISLEGFWRSFAAITLLIPFTSMSLVSKHLYNRNCGIPDRLDRRLVWHLRHRCASWIGSRSRLFSLSLRASSTWSRAMCRSLSRGTGHRSFSAALAAIVDLLHLVGVLPSPALPLAGLIAAAVVIYLSYNVTRTALGVSALSAVPIVVLDILVSLTSGRPSNRLG